MLVGADAVGLKSDGTISETGASLEGVVKFTVPVGAHLITGLNAAEAPKRLPPKSHYLRTSTTERQWYGLIRQRGQSMRASNFCGRLRDSPTLVTARARRFSVGLCRSIGTSCFAQEDFFASNVSSLSQASGTAPGRPREFRAHSRAPSAKLHTRAAFADLSHFERRFKAEFGRSPAEVRSALVTE